VETATIAVIISKYPPKKGEVHMPTLNQQLRPNEKEVAAKVMDGEAILINLSNGIYYSMDKVGSLIWEMIEKSSSVEKMTAAISAHYDIPLEQARTDIERLVGELVDEKLVIEMDSEAPRAELEPPNPQHRLPYESPQLNIYRDMGDLLALDPPMPGLADITWKEPED
jgi:hypothetical protein